MRSPVENNSKRERFTSDLFDGLGTVPDDTPEVAPTLHRHLSDSYNTFASDNNSASAVLSDSQYRFNQPHIFNVVPKSVDGLFAPPRIDA